MGAPDWVADAIFYQIFPERFANADPALDPPGVEPWGSPPTRENFFGGDLAGIEQHLDHVVSLGANALYLTPIFEAGTNHRYDATDYFTVDHRLGDQAAFAALVDAAHEKGIRIVLDAVFNHCGDGHWAFQDVVQHEASSAYVNWFSVESFPVATQPVPNYRTCSGCDYLPKWNTYNPEVREHHYAVTRHWIEQGIDGWRLDVPYFINHNFWRGFRDVVKAIDDDLYIVAEEWREPEQWLTGDLADGTMNYTLRDLVLGFTADRSIDARAFADAINALTDRIPTGYHHGMLNLLGSHDTERVLTRHGGHERTTLLAFDLMFSAHGAPMIYYGDEVGLTGENDPGCRGTMPWDEGAWAADILARLRLLGALRAEHVPMRRGAQRARAFGDDTVLMVRHLPGRPPGESDTVVALTHRGDGVVVPISALPQTRGGSGWRVLEGATDILTQSGVVIGAASTVFLAASTGEA